MRVVLALALGVLLAGCGDGDAAVADAAGRYQLDQMDFARRLAGEHLLKNGKPRDDVSEEHKVEVRKAAVDRARSIRLELELRDDGAFMARLIDAKGEQRLGGTWSQDGADVLFRTTAIPGGRVTNIPDVTAKRTEAGLLFSGDVSGFVVPHAFQMRKVE